MQGDKILAIRSYNASIFIYSICRARLISNLESHLIDQCKNKMAHDCMSFFNKRWDSEHLKNSYCQDDSTKTFRNHNLNVALHGRIAHFCAGVSPEQLKSGHGPASRTKTAWLDDRSLSPGPDHKRKRRYDLQLSPTQLYRWLNEQVSRSPRLLLALSLDANEFITAI